MDKLSYIIGGTSERIKDWDMFSKSVSLTFNKKSAYRTILGGFLSIVILTLMGVYYVTLIKQMVDRTKYEAKTIEKRIDNRDKDFGVAHMNNSNVVIAYKIDHPDGYIRQSLSSYYQPYWNQVKYTAQANGQYIQNYTKLESLPCTYEMIELPEIKIDEDNHGWVCLDVTQATIDGNLVDEWSQLEFIVNKCHVASVEGWGQGNNQQVVDGVIDDAYIRYYVKSSYFDFDDFEDPVKTFIDGTYAAGFRGSGHNNRYTYKVRKNTYETKDNYINYEEKQSGEFYSIEEPIFQQSFNDYIIIHSSVFKLDTKSLHFEREVMTILDVNGVVGGIFEMIEIIFRFFFDHATKYFMFKYIINIFNKDSQQNKQVKVHDHKKHESICSDQLQDEGILHPKEIWERFVKKFSIPNDTWLKHIEKKLEIETDVKGKYVGLNDEIKNYF